MSLSIDYDQMAISEKFILLEELWQNMSSDAKDNGFTPEWHLKVLKQREENIQKSKSKFSNLEDAKSNKMFNNKLHEMTLSDDGTFTAYSKEYDEHYHSTKDGALKESLLKHVVPTMEAMQNRNEVNILDICFGLGFNALATLYYHKKNSLKQRVNIYSPELDASLIESLKEFTYPEEFDEFKHIIDELSSKKTYKDNYFHIELFLGDAREYVRKFESKFDIVYQDAFSPKVNPALWTQEYFKEIASSMKSDGILSTYSTALATRLALYENGFNLYLNSQDAVRDATIASKQSLKNFTLVDMEHKIRCNKGVRALRDENVL